MSFESSQNSVESGAAIELYKIEGLDNFYYTSSSTPFTYEDNVYIPVEISRTGPVVADKVESGTMSITFPFNDPFVVRYLSGTPPSPDRITIFRVHLSDASQEVIPFWAGDVAGVKLNGTDAKVSLSGLMNRTADQIPKRNFSWACNHVLYGARCRVPEVDHMYSFVVTSLGVNGVTVGLTDQENTTPPSTALATDIDYFLGGTLRTGDQGSQRMIIRFSQDSATEYTATLMVPLSSDEVGVGSQVTISAGCDRSAQRCYERFNNSSNYGGFTFIPSLNPFATDVKREN